MLQEKYDEHEREPRDYCNIVWRQFTYSRESNGKMGTGAVMVHGNGMGMVMGQSIPPTTKRGYPSSHCVISEEHLKKRRRMSHMGRPVLREEEILAARHRIHTARVGWNICQRQPTRMTRLVNSSITLERFSFGTGAQVSKTVYEKKRNVCECANQK